MSNTIFNSTVVSSYNENSVENHTDNHLDNPFPGLRPFTIEESHLFFGREGQSDEVLMKLYESRFVAVVGPSGSGKSSFIYCGVIPILYGGFLSNKTSSWNVVVARPGASPIDNLAEAINQKTGNFAELSAEDKKIKHSITSTMLRTSSLGLIEVIMQSKELAGKNTLILIDQFEELFRFRKNDDNTQALNEALTYVNLLMEAIRYEGLPIYVAITMRSDFIGECAFFPQLTSAINNSYYMIPQMTREQKKMAITGPVAVGGGDITPRLVQRLLNDLGDNPDQLPILQHSLMRTWDFWTKNQSAVSNVQEPVDIHHYEAIGTMSEALSMHANEAFDELSEDQKILCESLFKSLTEKGGDQNSGIRRPTRLFEIAAIAGVSEATIIPVIDKFREEGRSLITPAANIALNSNSMIDISHESLMRIWVRLKNWVDDESDAVQMYQRLSEAGAMYQIGKAGLWRPPDLQLALNWRDKHKPTLIWAKRYNPSFERTMVFLDYSQKEYETEQKVKEMLQKRTLRRTRIIALILGLFTVVSIAFLIYALAKRVEADQQRAAADKERQLAIIETKKAIRSEQNAKSQEFKATLSAKEAQAQKAIAEQQKEEAEKQKDIADLKTEEAIKAQNLATKNERLAKESEGRAKKSEAKAKENEEIANVEKNNAIAANKKARNLRLVSVAQAMAVKSLQLSDDAQLEALNAQQAYKFYTENEGAPYNGDIFNGLYAAIKNLEGADFNEMKGHTDKVSGVVSASAKGRYMFSAGSDGKILKWDAENLKATPKLLKQNNFVNKAIALSSDNSLLAVGGSSRQIQIFDVNSPESTPKIINLPVKVPQNPTVWFLSYPNKNVNGSGNELIVASSDKKLYVVKGDNLEEIGVTPAQINALAVSPDGNTIATSDMMGQIVLWDKAAKTSKVFYSNNQVPMHALRFSNNGQKLVAGDEKGRLRMWANWQQSDKPITLLGHRAKINDIAFSEDDKQLATASFDKTVRLWNMQKTNTEPITLRDANAWVWSLAFTPKGNQIIAGCRDNKMRYFYVNPDYMSDVLCNKIIANMSKEEWEKYVAEDINYEKTCGEKPMRKEE